MSADSRFRFCKEVQTNERSKLDADLTDKDFVLMWNLMPANYDEAKMLIPNLANVSQETVVAIVSFLNEKRNLTHGAKNKYSD